MLFPFHLKTGSHESPELVSGDSEGPDVDEQMWAQSRQERSGAVFLLS